MRNFTGVYLTRIRCGPTIVPPNSLTGTQKASDNYPVASSLASSVPRVARSLRSLNPLARLLGVRAKKAVDDTVSSWLNEDFLARLARVPVALGPSKVDPFGLDPNWTKYTLAAAAFLHRHYFRSEVFGIDRVPAGRILLIANHSGQVPLDGAIIGASMFVDAEPPRFIRAMVEKWTQTLPFVSMFFARVGQVVGVPENARALLERDEALLVFPEGSKGISKPFSKRYQLGDFGLGFMRLALETRTPIVPVAVIGAEEQYISLGNLATIAKVLHAPSMPILPQLLIPGGVLPLPTRYRLHFGNPMVFDGDPDDDDAVIEDKVQAVRQTIQSMLHRGLRDRKSIFF